MKIGIIIAMDIEFQRMVEILGGDVRGRVGENEVVLCHSGIGKVNAALGTMEFILKEHPDCILSTGLAGGLDADLRVRDIILASETCYHDVWCGEGNELGQVQGLPARYAANETLLQTGMRLKEMEQYSSRLKKGLLCTGDQFITNREKQRGIKDLFPAALAVDMESAAIAQTCYKANVPFLSIRIISDTPGFTDDHQQQWQDFLAGLCHSSFQFIRLFLAGLPSQI